MLQIIITQEKLEPRVSNSSLMEGSGACVDFSGFIRPEEGGDTINGIEYEAYVEMAESVMREKLTTLQQKHHFLGAEVYHRYGKIAVGEMAIWVRIWSKHRKEAYEANMEFMDELKKDVPIWKVATF